MEPILPTKLEPIHVSITTNRRGRLIHHEYYTDWPAIEDRKLELLALGLVCLKMAEYRTEATADIMPGHPDFEKTVPLVGYCCFRTPDDGLELTIELAREGVHACGCPFIPPLH